jgi:hypothetical protein
MVVLLFNLSQDALSGVKRFFFTALNTSNGATMDEVVMKGNTDIGNYISSFLKGQVDNYSILLIIQILMVYF